MLNSQHIFIIQWKNIFDPQFCISRQSEILKQELFRHFIGNLGEKYRRTDFSIAIFSDDRRLTLEGHEGWFTEWVLHGNNQTVRPRRQHGGDGVKVGTSAVDN